MTDDDLKALFAYLGTLKPVHHLVDNAEPPTQCKLCEHKHGLGDRNLEIPAYVSVRDVPHRHSFGSQVFTVPVNLIAGRVNVAHSRYA